MDTPLNQIEEITHNTLTQLGELTKADACALWRVSEADNAINCISQWQAFPEKTSHLTGTTPSKKSLSWLINKMAHKEIVAVQDLQDLPPEAASVNKYFASLQTKSLLCLPMLYDDTLQGFLCIITVTKRVSWSRAVITACTAVTELFGSLLVFERKKSEFELDRERLHTLMDNMPDTIYFKDLKSRFTLINKAQAAVLGIADPEDAVGKSDYDFFSQEHASEAYADEQEIIKTAEGVINKIEKSSKPDGTFIWHSSTKVPVFAPGGSIMGTVGISRDITQMKHYEDELQKSKNELEIRVQERTADLKRANEHLKMRLDQLAFINSVSYDLTHVIQLDDLLPLILKTFTARFPQSEAVICLKSGEEFTYYHGTQAFQSTSAHRAAATALKRLNSDQTPPLMTTCWRDDPRLKGVSWPELGDLSYYIKSSLLAENKYLGAIQIFTTQEYADRFEQERTLLTTLAAYAAVCLSNAFYYKEILVKARLDGELHAARIIQRKFIPESKPQIFRINLKGAYYPANEISGDYLDYFKTRKGDWVIVVADVAGKGIPAALLMTTLRSAFRIQGRDETSAKKLLFSVNEFIAADLNAQHSFLTALCLIISSDGKTMSYARAGHPGLLKLSTPREPLHTIEIPGIAIGLTPEPIQLESILQERTISLHQGDRFFIYTDGLIEAMNPDSKFYGQKRLYSLLKDDMTSNADEIIDLVMLDIKKFTRGAPNHDDLTLLALDVTE